MASYNYTTVITQVDDSTINFAIPSVTPSVTNIVPVDSLFENMITGVVENMGGNFMTSPLPNDYDLDSTTAGMGSVFGDSVYQYDGTFEAGLDTYTSQEYFLVTTAIDAGISAYPTTTDAEIARKAYLVALRAQAQGYFDAADYTNCNNRIKALTDYLFNITDGTLTFVATLPSPEQITLTGNNIFLTTYSGGWYNVLTNTLTEVEYPYTWNFVTPSQSKDVIQSFDYPDGVYTNYSSVMVAIVTGFANSAKLYQGTSYLLVTTTVDAQVTLYGANHNPNNTVQAAAYAQMLQLQTDIDTAFAAEDYDETNDLIAELQALLALGLSINLYAELTNASTMVIYFNSLPSGTYTNATGTLQNTLTLKDAIFNGFPASNLDLSTALDSSEYNFGTTYPDGVYQGTVKFYVDGLLFQGVVYLPVTTAWQCCISKAAGKKCGKLDTALQQANLNNAVRSVNTFNNVNTANGLISEGNRECTRCGCGCG